MIATPTAPAPAPRKRLSRSAGRSPSSAPRKYHGGQTATAPQSVCVDWVRMSGPACTVAPVRDLVSRYLDKPAPGPGGYFLLQSLKWGTAALFWGSENPAHTHAVLNLPAGSLREIGAAGTLTILRELSKMGWKATRLDIALDFHDGAGRDLIARMHRSCQDGELCGARRYQHIWEMGQDGPTGHGLNIGARGKLGSGRYLRTYDKGLEQRSAGLGDWVRMEVEFSDDCAAQAAVTLAQASKPDRVMVGLVLGTVDFRLVTGDQHVADRPRCEWWQALIAGAALHRPVAVRAKSTAAGYIRWIKTAVVPKAATMAAATGLTLGGLLATISGPVDPNPAHLQDGVVRAILTDLGLPVSHARRALDDTQLLSMLQGVT